jgi:hypothetical protein
MRRCLSCREKLDCIDVMLCRHCERVVSECDCPKCGAGPNAMVYACHYWSRFGNAVYLNHLHKDRITAYLKKYSGLRRSGNDR